MQSFSADNPPVPIFCSGALTRFVDEVYATFARLFAYVGALALFDILGLHRCGRLANGLASGRCPRVGNKMTVRSSP